MKLETRLKYAFSKNSENRVCVTDMNNTIESSSVGKRRVTNNGLGIPPIFKSVWCQIEVELIHVLSFGYLGNLSLLLNGRPISIKGR